MELVGAGLVRSRGAQRIVSRLLVRNTRKRARIADLWDDAWMSGGATAAPEEERAGTPCAPSRGASGDDVLLRSDQRAEAATTAQVPTGTWDGDAPELWKDAEDASFYDDPTWMEGFSEGQSGEEARLDGEEGEEEEDGCLLDLEGIDSITRQEVV
ncbi:hypothetical protein HYPSUDRAFT_68075 [Hypholoma sublateritium FD-334 SS-4]|uniref:Uncharacterized protein n=1 Tax=Hypholoma sublateritium (strain FD-334 SS-4) TaxID=945553 RepID=A0A0D2PMP4_HYPSF|nr:hypothetical protein HYPSUDRAFT_68075 [Hypholoma sublateritium FD-334 SS-4]